MTGTDARETRENAAEGGYAWYALLVLLLIYVCNFIDRQILSILAEDIKRDLQISDQQIGVLYGTVFAVFFSLFGIPLGRLADGWYRGRLISLGLLVWSGMTALSGHASTFGQLTAARIGVGIGEATAVPASYSLLGDYFSRERKGTVLGIYMAGSHVGMGLSLVVGGAIVAWGETDIYDPQSELHKRYEIGVHSRNRYHSVDPGKLTMAPYFAEKCANRIVASA